MDARQVKQAVTYKTNRTVYGARYFLSAAYPGASNSSERDHFGAHRRSTPTGNGELDSGLHLGEAFTNEKYGVARRTLRSTLDICVSAKRGCMSSRGSEVLGQCSPVARVLA